MLYSRAAEGIKIINQLDDEVFTIAINYVYENMSSSHDTTAQLDDDGGLERSVI